jgi:PQQ-dependent dehydrogenase (methanol/ethanol family)
MLYRPGTAITVHRCQFAWDNVRHEAGEREEMIVGRSKKVGFCISLVVASLPLSSLSLGADSNIPQEPGCCTPASTNFPMVNANYGNTMYSSLNGITNHNVGGLGGAWMLHVDGGVISGASQQATLVEANGVIYVESQSQNISAVDAGTGAVKWTYVGGGTPGIVRGVAVAQGRVYAALTGRRVVALDQATGQQLWLITINDPNYPGGTTPTAPVYYDGLLYVGTGGGDSSYRGRAYALNAVDGSIAWTFWGTAAPGTTGGTTWTGNSWQTGGAAPWMSPAVDPALNIVYWTFGNPFPVNDGSTRAGDNLFSNSIVAMDAHTGAYLWHFQTVKHDLWDYDNVMAPVLMDVQYQGKTRKVVAVAGKTGFLYVLDRTTGQPLQSVAYLPVPQQPLQNTSATQPIPFGEPFVPVCPDPDFDPVLRPVPNYVVGCLFTPFWDKTTLVTPGSVGGADWGAISFNPGTGLVYFGAALINGAWTNTGKYRPIGEYRNSGRIVAMDPALNRVVWERHTNWSLSTNGMLTTAGKVMFIGQPDGNLVAFDLNSGQQLWQFQTGAGVHTSPITYSINGVQYVAVFAGGNSTPYASPTGDNLWAFKLGGTVPPAATPTPPSIRQPITATAVAGSTVANTILLGRTSATSAESTTNQNAMYPQNLVVPVGTTVTFTNPAGSTSNHCADSFFQQEFNSGVLQPGQSFTHAFNTAGEYYYNDCVWPHITGKVVVQ